MEMAKVTKILAGRLQGSIIAIVMNKKTLLLILSIKLKFED